MDAREVLLRLMYRAFIDIRLSSANEEGRTANAISNLIHNIPLAMLANDDDCILQQLKGRAEILGMTSWLSAALGDMVETNRSENE